MIAAPFGASAARTCLIDLGADPKQATVAWVTNHYRWVVWKLASYDRKLHGSCVESGGGAGHCLTVENVVLQLQRRWVGGGL